MARKKRTAAFTAIFESGEDGSFDVRFVDPVMDGCFSGGTNFMNAYEEAQEAMALYVDVVMRNHKDVKEFPVESEIDFKSLELNPETERLVVVVCEDIYKYRPQKAVNKTVTLPYWLNEMAEKEHINFSGVLQEALKEKLEV